jgi:hypothetical protein
MCAAVRKADGCVSALMYRKMNSLKAKETYEHPVWPAAIAIDPESGRASSVAREVRAQTNSLPVFIRAECGAMQSNSKE